MDHETDVGFVDAHAEGVGAHHHPDAVRFPVLLPHSPDGAADAGVVERRAHPFVAEHLSDFLGLLSVSDVHDAGTRDAVAHGHQLPGLVLAPPDDVGEVRPLETGLEEVLLLESEPVHDVFRDRGRRRGGEGNHGCIDTAAEGADFQVLGPEVITPLRDAVRLVHDDERNGEDGEVTLEQTGLEPFGGDVEEFAVAVSGVVQGQIDLVAIQSGMDRDGLDSPGSEVLDLVLHQGYKRGHNKGETVLHEGRNLEADRLASSRREDGQHIPSRERLFDDALLHGTERIVPPIGFQCLQRCHFVEMFAI